MKHTILSSSKLFKLAACVGLVFSALSAQTAVAQDQEVVTLGDTITGNQEQPKVLYIVPWKQTSDDTILEQGLESRLSDVFDHVERSEHARELEFFEELAEPTVLESVSNESEK